MSIERWCSFAAWKEEGLCVRKGERSRLKSPTGTALFSEDQTEDFDALEAAGIPFDPEETK